MKGEEIIMLDDPNDYTNHPDDKEGNWDYDSMPDLQEYFEKDGGNLDRFNKDYDKWEEKQYEKEDKLRKG